MRPHPNQILSFLFSGRANYYHCPSFHRPQSPSRGLHVPYHQPIRHSYSLNGLQTGKYSTNNGNFPPLAINTKCSLTLNLSLFSPTLRCNYATNRCSIFWFYGGGFSDYSHKFPALKFDPSLEFSFKPVATR